MNVLVVCHGPAYGDDRSYNGLRLAGELARRDDVDVRVQLIGDAVACAIEGQKVPYGYYHLDRLVAAAGRQGAQVGCCASSLDARGIDQNRLVAPARPSPLEELADWVLWADRTVSY